jgi:alkylation response protein AidB-like acyl-CoA dehydrogenase
MSAELTEEQGATREMALEFAQTKFAGEWDEKKSLPAEALRQAAAQGVGGSRVRKLSTDRGSADRSASRRRGDQPAQSEGGHGQNRDSG